ncbi:glycosyltransferase [Dyadobacter bucti]|uniref:glycosyltransferase n=1 Tax=Dyadobacter bucti TaxID=2572203 RepID=UPI003F6F8900
MEYPATKLSGEEREKWIRKNAYYYKNQIRYLKFIIPEQASVLQIGCGTGFLLDALQPARGVGIDSSESFIAYARERRDKHRFFAMDAEDFRLDETFDFILLSDSVGDFMDVQKVFTQMQRVCTPQTRIVIISTNFLWLPALNLGEIIRLKMPKKRQNWLDKSDIVNLLELSGFEVVASTRKILFPRYIPFISAFLNRFVGNLPLINQLCLINCLVARSLVTPEKPVNESSVSVIVPARNEKGNIESLVQRLPRMGKHTEIIFIEGNSRDDTWHEIQRIGAMYQGKRDIKWAQQDGSGKGDAVRKGFQMATGDILMILDADMTVPPEELPKFYAAINSGKGEYINGTRLVYPMENEAMQTLNLIGNKFFSMVFTWLLAQPLKDTLCGTKVLSRENYKKLAANRYYFGDFDPFGDFDLLFGAAKLHLKFIEVPIRYKARTYGETNISRFRHGWLLLKMTFFALSKIKFI